MGFWSNVLEALLNLLATRQRSALALIGIVIGTGSVVAMVSIGGMVQGETLKRFEAMGPDLVSLRLRAHEGLDGLRLADLAMLDTGLAPWLRLIAPTLDQSLWLEQRGQGLFLTLLGTTANLQALHDLRVTRGRFISPFDRYRRFGVVGHEIVEYHAALGRSLDLGDILALDGQAIAIIGFLAPAPPDFFGGIDVNSAVILPISSLSRVSDSPINAIAARLQPGLAHRTAASGIADWFARHHPRLSVQIRSPEQIIEQMQQQMRLLTLMLGAIGSISLIVGGVGVMNIMLVSVTERRREIGVRLAIGARRRDVRMQFLTEAVILALIGGLFGLALGAATAWAVAFFFGWGFFIAAPVLLLGFGVSAAIGVFFGFYPAVQASNVDPIQALRS